MIQQTPPEPKQLSDEPKGITDEVRNSLFEKEVVRQMRLKPKQSPTGLEGLAEELKELTDEINNSPYQNQNNIDRKYNFMNLNSDFFSRSDITETSKDTSVFETSMIMLGTTVLMFAILLVGSCVVLASTYLYISPILSKNDSRRKITIGLQWFYLTLGIIGAFMITMKDWINGNELWNLVGFIVLVGVQIAICLPPALELMKNKEEYSAFMRAYLGLSGSFGLIMGIVYILQALKQ
jgi:hypothetical protein